MGSPKRNIIIGDTERERLDPPLRWVGSKRWLVDRLCPEIEALQPTVYVEPFLGAGAINLNLVSSCVRVIVDNNPTLMDMWRCIKELPESLIAALRRIEDQYGESEVGYFQARAKLNEMILAPRMIWVERAAHAIYINARCFNGLWRTNKTGFYNVPFGEVKNPRKLEAELILKYANRLAKAMIVTGDGIEVNWKDPGTQRIVVYADPPYDGTFADYTSDGFTWNHQVRLAAALRYYAESGATIYTTNADTERVREIYQGWAKIEAINETHSVGSKAEHRGKRGCLLMRAGRGISWV